MDSNPIANWWCCLYPSERSVMGVTAEGLLLTMFAGFPLALWDAAWVVSGRGGPTYKEAFLHLYHLQIVTIEIDGLPVDVVLPFDDFLAWWVDVVLWLTDPASTCVDGCPQSQRPVM